MHFLLDSETRAAKRRLGQLLGSTDKAPRSGAEAETLDSSPMECHSSLAPTSPIVVKVHV